MHAHQGYVDLLWLKLTAAGSDAEGRHNKDTIISILSMSTIIERNVLSPILSSKVK